MVHRPADARLLTNLLNHEKEYHKHLLQLLDASAAALASFTAYTASGSPALANTILSVAGKLAAGDEALAKYARAVDGWREQLKLLKDQEDDVGSIMRDREILVTRLLKASKSPSKPSQQRERDRESILSSTSNSSLTLGGPKLSSAQAELQACEAHLSQRSQELDSLRVRTMKEGLTARCRALVECAWTWGELGKQGLSALDGEIAEPQPMPTQFFKPLPDPSRPGPPSDLSLTPSHSASNTGVPTDSASDSAPGRASPSLRTPRPTQSVPQSYTLDIPAAHAMADVVVPASAASSVSRPSLSDRRRVSMVAEEDEEGGSSADEAARGAAPAPQDLTVVENDRFRTWPAEPAAGKQRPALGLSLPRGESSSTVRVAGAEPPSPLRERKPSRSGIFGGLAGLFGRNKNKQSASASPSIGASASNPEAGGMGAAAKAAEKWQTRTDKNLARARGGAKKKRGDESSDEELPASLSMPASPWIEVPNTPRLGMNSPRVGGSDVGPAAGGLKKTKSVKRRASAQSVPAGPSTATEDPVAAVAAAAIGPSVTRRESKKARHVSSPAPAPTVSASASPVRASTTPATTTSPKRTNSLASASAVNLSTAQPKAPTRTRRAQSVDLGPVVLSPAVAPGSASVRSSADAPRRASGGHKRSATVGSGSAPGKGESLMDIVDSISARNRAAWGDHLQGPGMALVRAPPPVDMADLKKAPSPPAPLQAAPKKTAAAAQAAPTEKAPSRQASVRTAKSDAAPSRKGSVRGRAASKERDEGEPEPVMHRPVPGLMPLKSVLKHPSRTPSPAPVPGPSEKSVPPRAQSPLREVDPTPAAVPTPIPVPAPMLHPVKSSEMDDGASVSSYETGHEVFESDSGTERRTPTPPLVASPPAILPASASAPTGQQDGGTELSVSSSSTAAPGDTPKRRKSVRMSLPPTFSRTPPAFDEKEEVEGRYPWSEGGASKQRTPRTASAPQPAVAVAPPTPEKNHVGLGGAGEKGWRTRNGQGQVKDMWEDSDAEDEEYGIARRMLAVGS